MLLSEILMDFSALSLWPRSRRATNTVLLRLSAERAFRRPRLERLAAVPAEAGLGRVAVPEARLDVRDAVVTAALGPARPPHGFAGGQHVFEHFGGARVA